MIIQLTNGAPTLVLISRLLLPLVGLSAVIDVSMTAGRNNGRYGFG